MIFKLVIGVMLALLLPAPVLAGEGHAHGPDGSHISDDFSGGGSGDVITLSKEAEKNIGIETLVVKRELHTPTKTLYGRVIADPRRVSVVAAPFEGRVEKVYVLPGSFVQKGEELLRVTPVQVGGQSTILRSSISGYVTDLKAAAGKIFSPTDALVSLGDLSVVMFEGDLFDSTDTARIENTKHCTVHTKRYPNKPFDCRVETVDAVFRGNPPVGHVHVSISNPDTELKPGMTGQVHLGISSPEQVLTIPKTAVLGKFEKQFVYLKKDGSYHRTSVGLGDSFGDNVTVLEGLSSGDEVVVRGHYQLQFAKSETSAEEGDHHEHDHPHPHSSEKQESAVHEDHGDHAHGDHGHDHDDHDHGSDEHSHDHGDEDHDHGTHSH